MNSNFIKNTSATIIYFLCQYLTTFVVVWISGYYIAGEYAIIISVANIFATISLWGGRSLQISDVTNEFSTGNYLYFRLITIGFSYLCLIPTIIVLQENAKIKLLIIIFLLFKNLENITDVLYGTFQKNNKYNYILTSMVLKGILTFVFFCMGLIINNSLSLSIAGMVISYLGITFFYDLKSIKKIEKINVCKKNILVLLKESFPLMIFSILMPFNLFITRYFVKQFFSSEILGYYATISAVLVIIPTVTGAVYSVLIPILSKEFTEKNIKKIKHILLLCLLLLFVFSIICIAFTTFFGRHILKLFFGTSILEYLSLLLPVVVTGILISVAMCLNTFLISIKKNTRMLICNIVGTLICICITVPLTKKFSVYGANASMIIGFSIQIILLLIVLLKTLSLFDKPEIEVVK